MKLKIIPGDFTVCRVACVPSALLQKDFCFVGKTDEELSLVCRTADVPADTAAREDGWRAFRFEGVLDFSLIGILASVAAVLAENGISMFAVSTYNTDYVLLKKENFDRGIGALGAAGYEIERDGGATDESRKGKANA